MKRITCLKIDAHGAWLVCEMEDGLNQLEELLRQMGARDADEREPITITVVECTQDEIDAMPEFDGY